MFKNVKVGLPDVNYQALITADPKASYIYNCFCVFLNLTGNRREI